MRTTIEIGSAGMQVDIEYRYWPEEPRVNYYADGSGYPGSSAYAELIGVSPVIVWTVCDEDRVRDDHWVWDVLDDLASNHVADQWDHFEAACITDHEREVVR